jgi:hypothetical protein
LINIDYLLRDATIIVPILIHELCHYIEQAGLDAKLTYSDNDVVNAAVILDGLAPNVRALHSDKWAKMLGWAARQSVAKDKSVSVRHFIEEAIPSYDRPLWQPDRIREQERSH